MQKSAMIRVTIDLAFELNTRLERLVQVTNASSKASVIRKALRLFEYVERQHREGAKFVEQKDGKETIIVLDFLFDD